MDQKQEIWLAELLSALRHALDMTEGQPEGHCVGCCWIGTQIGREIGLGEAELYYTLLPKDLGCSSNAARICRLYLTDDLTFKRLQTDRLRPAAGPALRAGAHRAQGRIAHAIVTCLVAIYSHHIANVQIHGGGRGRN